MSEENKKTEEQVDAPKVEKTETTAAKVEKAETPVEDMTLLSDNSIDILKEWIANKLILPRT